jgi:hypothetical protein
MGNETVPAVMNVYDENYEAVAKKTGSIRFRFSGKSMMMLDFVPDDGENIWVIKVDKETHLGARLETPEGEFVMDVFGGFRLVQPNETFTLNFNPEEGN